MAGTEEQDTEFMPTAADTDSTLPRRLFCVVRTRTCWLSEAQVVVRAHVHRPCTLTRQTVNQSINQSKHVYTANQQTSQITDQ